MENYLPVENRGGVVFNISKDGQATTQIQSQQLNVSLSV